MKFERVDREIGKVGWGGILFPLFLIALCLISLVLVFDEDLIQIFYKGLYNEILPKHKMYVAGFLLGFLLLLVIILYFLKGLKILRKYLELGHHDFKKKFIEGFEKLTPAQITRAELNGIIIILIGITMGLVITPIVRIQGVWYWAEIILIGSFIVTIIQLISKWQLYRIQKKQDEIMKNILNDLNKKTE